MPTGGLTDQRVLITGGAGFIGSHLSERLLAEENLLVDGVWRTAEELFQESISN